ncbi:zeatin O-glucosyltransferase-like [Fagus crenata]
MLNLIVIKIIVHATLFILITSTYKNPNTNPLEDPIIHSSRFYNFYQWLTPIPSNHVPNGLNKTKVVVVMVPFPKTRPSQPPPPPLCLIMAYNIPIHYAFHGWDPNSDNIYFMTSNPTFSLLHQIPTHQTSSLHISNHCSMLPCIFVTPWLNFYVNSSKAARIIVINDSMMAWGSKTWAQSQTPSHTLSTVSPFAFFLYLWESMGKTKPLETKSKIIIPKDLPSHEDCFTNEFLSFVGSQCEFQKLSSGCLYNTCRIIEGAYMDLMEKLENKKQWAIGPFNPVKIAEKKGLKGRHKCLEWLLDKQAPNSVLYVCFGTTTAMEEEQIKELAIGLEQSEQKFIWVLREADKGDVFINGELSKAEILKGFEERVKERGLVVRDWAPQLEILSHTSTSGFMSHCGWNSCLESITMGVPIAAWPMASDQPRNTVLITKLLKVGIVVKDWSRRNQLVTSKTIENAVKTLMASEEGDEMRKRTVDLGGAVRGSMDNGGVSRLELNSFITHITR